MLYNLYSGGLDRCSGTTTAGKACRSKGYTINRSRGYWCVHHRGRSAWESKATQLAEEARELEDAAATAGGVS